MTTELNAMQARAALVRERLPEHLDRLGWSTERIAAHQRDALRQLLRTAIDHSPFHAARLHGVEPERFELSDLVSLPIMTKAEMIAAYDDAPNGLDARVMARHALARDADVAILRASDDHLLAVEHERLTPQRTCDREQA